MTIDLQELEQVCGMYIKMEYAFDGNPETVFKGAFGAHEIITDVDTEYAINLLLKIAREYLKIKLTEGE